jgi:hypothetical protein
MAHAGQVTLRPVHKLHKIVQVSLDTLADSENSIEDRVPEAIGTLADGIRKEFTELTAAKAIAALQEGKFAKYLQTAGWTDEYEEACELSAPSKGDYVRPSLKGAAVKLLATAFIASFSDIFGDDKKLKDLAKAFKKIEIDLNA